MTRSRFTIALVAALLCSACGATLPPIKVTFPETPAAAKPAPAPEPKRATLAFEVLDDATGAPIATAFATLESGQPKQANDAGYIAFELPIGIYSVRFEADDYTSITRRYQVEVNRQFPVRLKSTKPPAETPAAAAPTQPPTVTPAPVPEPVPPPPAPPAPTPAAAPCAEVKCVHLAAQRYPKLLSINTYQSCVEFVQRALELLGPDWGHVGKTRGEAQGVPRTFAPREMAGSDDKKYQITGVSHDAIKHRATGQVVDIVGAAAARSLADTTKHQDAGVTWNLVPPHEWRANNPFVPTVLVR